MTITINLRCGTLNLLIDDARMPLDQLCGFGTRRNRKRGFLFISKVLGKHIPVRPSLMDRVHGLLADSLPGDVAGPVVFIALAETATALGQGVFESWLRATRRTDALFLHSTRYRLSRPLALSFDESHSHATEHFLYEPARPDDRDLFRSARTLVLVDDEISTGRTLFELANAYCCENPDLEALHLVSITDWLEAEWRPHFAEDIHLPVSFHSVLRGRFDFHPAMDFDPGPVPDVTGGGQLKDAILPRDGGRVGTRSLVEQNEEDLIARTGLRGGERVLVLGTGEFAYPPYRLALALERRGWDVHYQSTTRSPILVGEDIASVIEFTDNYGDGMPNYVYNVADREYDAVLIGYETRRLPADHDLPNRLGACVLFL